MLQNCENVTFTQRSSELKAYYVIGLMEDGKTGEYLNVYTRCQNRFQLEHLTLKGKPAYTGALYQAYREQDRGHTPNFQFLTDGEVAVFKTHFGNFHADVREVSAPHGKTPVAYDHEPPEPIVMKE